MLNLSSLYFQNDLVDKQKREICQQPKYKIEAISLIKHYMSLIRYELEILQALEGSASLYHS